MSYVTKLSRSFIVSAIAGVSLFATGTAQADVVSLDSGNGYYNDAHELVIKTGTNSITVLPGLYDEYGTVTPRADGTKLGQFNQGLGVNRPGDSSHQVDGRGANDIVIFDFLDVAVIEEITFTHVDSNDKFDFFLDTDNDGVLELIQSGISITGNALNYAGGSVATVALGNLLQATGALFGIGASGHNDNFKIDGLTLANAEIPSVPVPAALPLMATALAGFGFSKRKTKKQK